MSKKFHAVNKETGERWKQDGSFFGNRSYLIMYDTGFLAVVSEYPYEGSSIVPLDTSIWKPVLHESLKNLVDRF